MDLVFGKLFHFWLPSQMFITTELRWLQMKKNKFVLKFGMLSQTSSLQLSTKDFFAHWVAFFGYFGETGWLPHRSFGWLVCFLAIGVRVLATS